MKAEDFKLDPNAIPPNAAFQYGYYPLDPLFFATSLSNKLGEIESRISEIDKEIARLQLERDAITLLAKDEYERSEGAFPRFSGYRSFVENDSRDLHVVLRKLSNADLVEKFSEEDKNIAKMCLENFILLFFRGGGSLDIDYSIDFLNTETSFAGEKDHYPSSVRYEFIVSRADIASGKISQKKVQFFFYSPKLIDSFSSRKATFEQWRNVSLGKIIVTVIDLKKEPTSLKNSSMFPPMQYLKEDYGTKVFRSFNPFEIAAWLQISIMGLEKNRFVIEEEKDEDKKNGL